jgi:mannan endo-1,4-beta-mannosidase
MKTPSKATATLAATIGLVIVAGLIAMTSLKHYDRQAAAATGTVAPQGASVSASTMPTPSASVPKVVTATLPSTGFDYLGVYEGSDTSASQFTSIDQFAQAIGRPPNIVLYYSGWGEPFSVSFAQTALQNGATLLVDIDPTTTTCASIAAGEEDAFLDSYAQAVKSFGHPVIISFGHEMNGNWYPWGWTHTQPAVFVQAWRHIVDVFRQNGADNVTWVWTVNSVNPTEGPLADYWPGDSYVDWVAFDAYYYNETDTFTGVTSDSITAIRQITQKPILIGETAIGQVAGQARELPGLFAGVSNDGLLGFIWFDQDESGSVYKQDWRIEDNPAAITAFRAGVASYFK